MNVQTNCCMCVKQLHKIMKLYYFYTLKAMWDGRGKIMIDYWMPMVEKQLSGKKSIPFPS